MKDFFNKIFRRQRPDTSTTTSFPSDWNLTISALMEELKAGKRSQIAEPELTWAREYERSLIPKSYRFPRKGDLYEVKIDLNADYMTAWSAPYTGGGTAKIYKGEQIWIETEPTDERPIGVYALPVNYEKLEKRIVPESDRSAFKYEGFYFHISTKSINEDFELLKVDFEKDPYV